MFSILLLFVCTVFGHAEHAKVASKYVDLSHWFSEKTPIWPIHVHLKVTKITLRISKDVIGHTEGLVMSTHTATHIDAPMHAAEGRYTLDQIPRDDLHGPGVVVDVEDKAKKYPNYAITKQDILDFEAVHGRVPKRGIVLFNTGWSKKWNNVKDFLGNDHDDMKSLYYPGISGEAAKFLVHERDIVGVGVDTVSLDTGNTVLYEAHTTLCGANKWGLENVADVHLLPPKGFWVYVFPMKLLGASGGPTRVIAFLDE